MRTRGGSEDSVKQWKTLEQRTSNLPLRASWIPLSHMFYVFLPLFSQAPVKHGVTRKTRRQSTSNLPLRASWMILARVFYVFFTLFWLPGRVHRCTHPCTPTLYTPGYTPPHRTSAAPGVSVAVPRAAKRTLPPCKNRDNLISHEPMRESTAKHAVSYDASLEEWSYPSTLTN